MPLPRLMRARRYPAGLDMELRVKHERFVRRFNNQLLLDPSKHQGDAPTLGPGGVAVALLHAKQSDHFRGLERILGELERSLGGIFNRSLRVRVSTILADVKEFSSRSADEILDYPDVSLEQIRRIALVTGQLANDLTGADW